MSMESGVSLSSSTSSSTSTSADQRKAGEMKQRGISQRRLPLHTLGASASAIAGETWKRAETIEGPIGSATTKISAVISPALPAVFAVRSLFLTLLFFADARILALEGIFEKFFPFSSKFFDKIDDCVGEVESLPGKLDEFHKIMQKFPILDFAILHLISWLKFFNSALTQSGSENAEEEEMIIDADNVSNLSGRSEKKGVPEPPAEASEKQCDEDESRASGKLAVNKRPFLLGEEFPGAGHVKVKMPQSKANPIAKPPIRGYSYKEALKKGTDKEKSIGNSEVQTAGEGEASPESAITDKEEGIGGYNNTINKEGDPILELFETSWHMNSGNRGALPRCSCHVM